MAYLEAQTNQTSDPNLIGQGSTDRFPALGFLFGTSRLFEDWSL
jgi:hypothetical protein